MRPHSRAAGEQVPTSSVGIHAAHKGNESQQQRQRDRSDETGLSQVLRSPCGPSRGGAYPRRVFTCCYVVRAPVFETGTTGV